MTGNATRAIRRSENETDPELHRDGLGLDGVGDMGDERIETGAALGLEDGGHGGRVSGVSAQAVDGLGRQDDEAAIGQDARGLGVGHGQPRCA